MQKFENIYRIRVSTVEAHRSEGRFRFNEMETCIRISSLILVIVMLWNFKSTTNAFFPEGVSSLRFAQSKTDSKNSRV